MKAIKSNLKTWTVGGIPSQEGKRAVVTGTGGIGFETALVLAKKGADVILAGRNPAKGESAVRTILGRVPRAQIRFERLDLADLGSVARCAQRLAGEGRPIDLLVNNAAVMSLPRRQVTTDGFEMQFGTNHLGHFALTAHLLPLLRRAVSPRIVTVSSLAHRGGKIRFSDLQAEKTYHPWKAYSQSKLANLLFTFELQRRSDAGGWNAMSSAAHPGYARTELIPNGPGTDSILSKFSLMLQPFLSHSPAEGALPVLVAATWPEAERSGYYGPNGFYELIGPPAPAYVAPQVRNGDDARNLWDISCRLTGVSWPDEGVPTQVFQGTGASGSVGA